VAAAPLSVCLRFGACRAWLMAASFCVLLSFALSCCLWRTDFVSLLASAAAERGASITLEVGYLRSYQHMGQALLHCEGGCRCEDTVLDGNWGHQYSLTEIHSMQVRQADRQTVGGLGTC
jgi:hypothetical protein